MHLQHRASRPQSLVVAGLALLFTLANPGWSQTFVEELRGATAGEGFGVQVAPGRSGQSNIFGYYISSPDHVSATGKVEFWERNGSTLQLRRRATGTNPGDRYGARVAYSQAGFSQRIVCFTAPGANGGAGRIERRSTPRGPFTGLRLDLVWRFDGTQSGEGLGESVAISPGTGAMSGIDQIVIVGAPGWNGPGTLIPARDAGRVMVLDSRAGTLIREHRGTLPGGNFGAAVAGLTDVNGDGIDDYAISEPGYDVRVSGGLVLQDAGRVLIHSGATGTLINTIEGATAGMRFGSTLATGGDVDGDGTGDVVIGSPDLDLNVGTISLTDIGQVRVCSGIDGRVIFTRNGGLRSRFGTAVDGGLDLNGDGRAEVLVGSPADLAGDGVVELFDARRNERIYRVEGFTGASFGTDVRLHEQTDRFEDRNFTASGPAFLGGRGILRTFRGTVDWSFPAPVTGLGSQAAVLDDVDGDGIDDLAFGQYDPAANFVVSYWEIRSGRTSEILYESSNTSPQGHVIDGIGDVDGDGTRDLVHAEPGGDRIEVRSGDDPATIIGSLLGPIGSEFGVASVDVGDITGDGVPDFAIAGPRAASGPVGDVGIVILYSGATFSIIRAQRGQDPAERFGTSLAGLGDVDGDGIPDYAAGSTEFDLPGTLANVGIVRVFSGATGNVIGSITGGIGGTRSGQAIAAVGDLNGDGLADFAVAEREWQGIGSLANSGRLVVYAGRRGSGAFSIIWSLDGRTAFASSSIGAIGATEDLVLQDLVAIGDVDRDGTSDLAASWLRGPDRELVTVHGSRSQRLLDEFRDSNFLNSGRGGIALAGYGGLHTDSRQELIISSAPVAGSTFPQPGGAEVLFLPRARETDLGGGCGGTVPDPTLRVLGMKPGQITEIRIGNYPASTALVTLYASLPVPEFVLGFGCAGHVDPLALPPLYVGPPNVNLPLLLPDDPAIAGAVLHLQAIGFDPAGPFGILLTNGVRAQFGF